MNFLTLPIILLLSVSVASDTLISIQVFYHIPHAPEHAYHNSPENKKVTDKPAKDRLDAIRFKTLGKPMWNDLKEAFGQLRKYLNKKDSTFLTKFKNENAAFYGNDPTNKTAIVILNELLSSVNSNVSLTNKTWQNTKDFDVGYKCAKLERFERMAKVQQEYQDFINDPAHVTFMESFEKFTGELITVDNYGNWSDSVRYEHSQYNNTFDYDANYNLYQSQMYTKELIRMKLGYYKRDIVMKNENVTSELKKGRFYSYLQTVLEEIDAVINDKKISYSFYEVSKLTLQSIIASIDHSLSPNTVLDIRMHPSYFAIATYSTSPTQYITEFSIGSILNNNTIFIYSNFKKMKEGNTTKDDFKTLIDNNIPTGQGCKVADEEKEKYTLPKTRKQLKPNWQECNCDGHSLDSACRRKCLEEVGSIDVDLVPIIIVVVLVIILIIVVDVFAVLKYRWNMENKRQQKEMKEQKKQELKDGGVSPMKKDNRRRKKVDEIVF